VQKCLSTDNSTNWVSGWRPFHSSLLVFSSHAHFQLFGTSAELSHSPTSYFTSLHFTQPNCRQLTCLSNQLLYFTSANWTADNSYSESESESLYDWRFTANQFVLATSSLTPTTRNFIFQLNTCGYSPYLPSSLTRWWVCRLELLLVLASAVILRFESRGTHDYTLLSQIRVSARWRATSPYLCPPRTGWPGYIPRHWVPFSSPPTTRRVTAEVFDPATTRDPTPEVLWACL
jgi:hypothetical protein